MALDVQRISGTSAKVAARLCNFQTGHAYLLPAHIDFLDTEVRSVIRGMQGPWVDLLGYASRVGDAAYNKTLSAQRLYAVKNRISEYASRVNFQIQEPRGEADSGDNERNNDGYYRAVEVYVYAFKPPPPKPTPVVEQTRRILQRSFTRTDVSFNTGGGGQEDEWTKEALQGLLDIIQGAEALAGDENLSQRRTAPMPSSHQVNRVTIDVDVRFNIIASGGTITTRFTHVVYTWGPPQANVVVENRYQARILGDQQRPQNETRSLPRRQAEQLPFVVPPAP